MVMLVSVSEELSENDNQFLTNIDFVNVTVYEIGLYILIK